MELCLEASSVKKYTYSDKESVQTYEDFQDLGCFLKGGYKFFFRGRKLSLLCSSIAEDNAKAKCGSEEHLEINARSSGFCCNRHSTLSQILTIFRPGAKIQLSNLEVITAKTITFKTFILS